MTRKLRKTPLPITAKRLAKRCLIGLLMVLGIAAGNSICCRIRPVAEKERKMSRFEALLDAAQAGAADCHDLPIGQDLRPQLQRKMIDAMPSSLASLFAAVFAGPHPGPRCWRARSFWQPARRKEQGSRRHGRGRPARGRRRHAASAIGRDHRRTAGTHDRFADRRCAPAGERHHPGAAVPGRQRGRGRAAALSHRPGELPGSL